MLAQVALKLRLHVDLRGAVVATLAVVRDHERRDGDLLVAADGQLRLQRKLELHFLNARAGDDRQQHGGGNGGKALHTRPPGGGVGGGVDGLAVFGGGIGGGCGAATGGPGWTGGGRSLVGCGALIGFGVAAVVGGGTSGGVSATAEPEELDFGISGPAVFVSFGPRLRLRDRNST